MVVGYVQLVANGHEMLRVVVHGRSCLADTTLVPLAISRSIDEQL
jgi:hypothetical protein